MGNLKTIIEFLKVIIHVYQYMDEQIDVYTFNKKVEARKKNYKKFIEGNRNDRLDVLRDENES